MAGFATVALLSLFLAYGYFDASYEAANIALETARVVECAVPSGQAADRAVLAAGDAVEAVTMKMYVGWAIVAMVVL